MENTQKQIEQHPIVSSLKLIDETLRPVGAKVRIVEKAGPVEETGNDTGHCDVTVSIRVPFKLTSEKSL